MRKTRLAGADLLRPRRPDSASEAGSDVGPGAVVAVGNYDGFHLGHQRAVAVARREALEAGVELAVVTFDPHPAALLRPSPSRREITSPAIKSELFAAAGVHHHVVLEFTRDVAMVSPKEFVERLLVGRLNARAVVQGPNFRFGKGRAGDLAMLRGFGDDFGFRVRVVEPVTDRDGVVVSSTRIREALAVRNLPVAESLLGRPYAVQGRVIPGAGRGRRLGFPTANLALDGDLLLPDGVYAAIARVGVGPAAPECNAIVHAGPRPTFDDSRSVEAHLIDYEGTPTHLRLAFRAFLREVRRFPDADALRAQLARDREAVFVAAPRRVAPSPVGGPVALAA